MATALPLSYHPGRPSGAIFFRRDGNARIICTGRRVSSGKLTLTAGPGVVQTTPQLATFMGTILKFPDQNDPEHMTAQAQEVALDRMLVDRFKGGDATALY